MKIAKVEAIPLKRQLEQYFDGGTYRIVNRDTIVTRVYTDKGQVGEVFGGDEDQSQGGVQLRSGGCALYDRGRWRGDLERQLDCPHARRPGGQIGQRIAISVPVVPAAETDSRGRFTRRREHWAPVIIPCIHVMAVARDVYRAHLSGHAGGIHGCIRCAVLEVPMRYGPGVYTGT